MPTIEQNRRLPVACGKLEAPRGGLVGRLHFGHDTSERPVAQAILGHRQHVRVFRTLRVKDPIGPKPDLLEPWGIKIEPRERPKHREAWLRCEPRRNTGHEQGGCGIVTQ